MHKTKIVDCFIFGLEYELDLLSLRLEYLNDIVDHFILVEAKFTHLGTEKDIFFEKNKKIFSKYLDKITHIVLDKPINQIAGSWDNEIYHRNQITSGLNMLNLQEDDIILISDLDEFPSKPAIEYYKNNNIEDSRGLIQNLFYYYFNFKADISWDGSQITRYKIIKDGITPQKIRDNRITSEKLPIFGGWHFSYSGGIKAIVNKLNGVTESVSVINYVNDLNLMKDAIDKKIIFFNNNPLSVIDVMNGEFPENFKNRYLELVDKGFIYV